MFQNNRRVPVVSPNGCLALVELPGPALGVVDMADGRVLQTLATRHYASFGFFQQGRCAFIQQPDHLLVFEVGAATSTQPSQPMIDGRRRAAGRRSSFYAAVLEHSAPSISLRRPLTSFLKNIS